MALLWISSLFLLLLLLVVVLSPPQWASAAVEDGLLENGNFETFQTDGFSSTGDVTDMGTDTDTDTTPLPGWTMTGTVELVRYGQKQGGMILVVPQGEFAVKLGNDAQVKHRLELEKGSTYSITFSAARTCAQLEALNVSLGSNVSSTLDLQTLYSVHGWDSYTWAFRAEEELAELGFGNPGMEDDPTCGPILDNVAIKKLFTPELAQDNAVTNGDFEEGPWMFPDATLGVLLPTNLEQDTSSLPGWIVESNRAVRYVDSDHYTVPQGKRAVELLSGKEGVISQMVATAPEKQYSLAFTVGSAGDSCQAPLAVTAFAGDQARNFHYSPVGNATHMHANLTFTALAERTRVAFYSAYYNTRSDDRSSLCGPVVDDVKVVAVSGAAWLVGVQFRPVKFVLVAFAVMSLVLG